MPYPIEPLGPDHNRAAFSCGTPLLDTFLHQRGGKDLLYDALYRTLRVSEEVATRAVIVDAVAADAVSFYAHHALRRFADDSNRFFYTMENLEAGALTREAPL